MHNGVKPCWSRINANEGIEATCALAKNNQLPHCCAGEMNTRAVMLGSLCDLAYANVQAKLFRRL